MPVHWITLHHWCALYRSNATLFTLVGGADVAWLCIGYLSIEPRTRPITLCYRGWSNIHINLHNRNLGSHFTFRTNTKAYIAYPIYDVIDKSLKSVFTWHILLTLESNRQPLSYLQQWLLHQIHFQSSMYPNKQRNCMGQRLMNYDQKFPKPSSTKFQILHWIFHALFKITKKKRRIIWHWKYRCSESFFKTVWAKELGVKWKITPLAMVLELVSTDIVHLLWTRELQRSKLWERERVHMCAHQALHDY
jgi:hypothetical protein